MLVNQLTTDLQLYIIDEGLTHITHPPESCIRWVRGGKRGIHRRQGGLEIYTGDQITITADRALHTLVKVGNTVEGLLNRLHGEVRVATIELLKKGNLGIRGQVHVLSAVGDELH